MSEPNSRADGHAHLLDFFFDYIAWLHVDWFLYQQLFGHSEERIRKLNRRTGAAFGRLQAVLLDRILLETAKLFDRPTIMGKVTASLQQAINELGLPDGHPRKAELLDEYKSLKAACEPILLHRNRRLAHNDRVVVMEQGVLPGAAGRCWAT